MNSRRVAILQSSYIPWRGYFDIIHDVDEFIFLDNVQFTSRDWRSRNRIKTAHGLLWLTVPVGSDRNRRICDVMIQDSSWQEKHWKSISHSYSKAKYFDSYRSFFEDLYLAKRWNNLSEMNQEMTKRIATELLGLNPIFSDSRNYPSDGAKLELILDIATKAGATTYVSGPSARDYIDPDRFRDAGILLEYKSYEGYPEYQQPHPPFEGAVSILDVIFNTGPEAAKHVWGWRELGN